MTHELPAARRFLPFCWFCFHRDTLLSSSVAQPRWHRGRRHCLRPLLAPRGGEQACNIPFRGLRREPQTGGNRWSTGGRDAGRPAPKATLRVTAMAVVDTAAGPAGRAFRSSTDRRCGRNYPSTLSLTSTPFKLSSRKARPYRGSRSPHCPHNRPLDGWPGAQVRGHRRRLRSALRALVPPLRRRARSGPHRLRLSTARV
jgi:hypothetical protein